MIMEATARAAETQPPPGDRGPAGAGRGGAGRPPLRRILSAEGRPRGPPGRPSWPPGRSSRRTASRRSSPSWWDRRRPCSWARDFTSTTTRPRSVRRAMLEAIDEFHRRLPESPGIPPDELRQSCGLEKTVLEGLVAILVGQGRLAERSGRLASPRHQATFSEEDSRRLEEIEGLFREAAFRPPSPEEIAAQDRRARRRPSARRWASSASTAGWCRSKSLFFHREAVDRARELLVEHLRREGRLESVRVQVPAGYDAEVCPAAVGLFRPHRRDPPQRQHAVSGHGEGVGPCIRHVASRNLHGEKVAATRDRITERRHRFEE